MSYSDCSNIGWVQRFVVSVVCIVAWCIPSYSFAAQGQIIKLLRNDGGTSFDIGDCIRVDIRVQTDGMDVNSVDIVLPYDSTLLAPYSNDECTGSVATSIVTDGLFTSYPVSGNNISDSTIYLTAFDSSGNSPVDTGAAPNDELLAHVFFKVLQTRSSYTLGLSFTLGSTLDTNMTEAGGGSVDALDSVDNLVFGEQSDAVSSMGPSTTEGSRRRNTPVYAVNPLGPLFFPKEPASEDLHSAALLHYDDVAESAWYLDAVTYFLGQGALDRSISSFYPERTLIRAESSKLLSVIHGMQDGYVEGVFDDVDLEEWYASFIDFSADQGWMRGYENCYLVSTPCFVGPGDTVTRSQAAAMMLRYHGVDVSNLDVVRSFDDVPSFAWYAPVISEAVDRCILRGDDATGLMRPDDPVNRAEFVKMFHRSLLGEGCS